MKFASLLLLAATVAVAAPGNVDTEPDCSLYSIAGISPGLTMEAAARAVPGAKMARSKPRFDTVGAERFMSSQG